MSLTDQSDRLTTDRGGSDLLCRSSLYREYLAERKEILKHKWCESRKAGRDIGFEAALVSWKLRHRSRWRQAWRVGVG